MNNRSHKVALYDHDSDDKLIPMSGANGGQIRTKVPFESRTTQRTVQWKTQAISRADLIADVLADAYE